MCRNIKKLFNFEPHVTNNEVQAASLQFVRKISGFTHPSQVNEEAFNRAVEEITHVAGHLLHDLKTTAEPHTREVEAAKAHARVVERFGKSKN